MHLLDWSLIDSCYDLVRRHTREDWPIESGKTDVSFISAGAMYTTVVSDGVHGRGRHMLHVKGEQ
jgi:hypothetical protein